VTKRMEQDDESRVDDSVIDEIGTDEEDDGDDTSDVQFCDNDSQ
jgi:hypothetical protein